MYRFVRRFFLLTALAATLPVTSFATDKVPVFVSVVPQKFFVQQIGKDLVEVQVMVEPGASPATYEPKPQQMAALSMSKIYFAIGAPFEKAWLEKIAAANPKMQMIHTDHGITKLAMKAHHHDDEQKGKDHHDAHHDHEEAGHHDAQHDQEKVGHDGDGHHEHAGLDPHIWLSPTLVKIQAKSMMSALQEADPEHKSVYEENFKTFMARIDQLDRELKTIFSGKKGLQFMVFHPAWGYFAHEYGLEQVPIEIEGKDPKPAELKELVKHAKEDGIKVIFVQPQFSTKSADVVARDIGGEVAFANPLAEDWIANLRQVAEKFKAALK